MLKSPEVRRFILLLLALTAGGSLMVYAVNPWAAVPAFLALLLTSLAALGFTVWRYRQLEKLARYLRRVREGDYMLELQDYAEGELSILKSELYKVTVTLRERGEALGREKAQLADAMSDISHQLKTPLTSLFVLTDLLSEGELPPDRREEFSDRVRAQLDRIRWLVDTLLKLSRLDTGTVAFSRRRVTAKELLERATAPLLIPMELKNIRFAVEDRDAHLFCDMNWTAEALLNILKNCVEHTPADGEIRVACKENPLFTEISVQDTGPGIAPEDLPHIFNRFYRGRNAGEDSVGIGLAMARSVAAAQEGALEARNIPGGGARFILRLPPGGRAPENAG